MHAKRRLISLVLSVALVGGACNIATQAVPVATPAEGPSQFLAGFSLAAVGASINATPNGPRCLGMPSTIPTSHEPRDSFFGGWSEAQLTTTCDDPGDGTALGQAWAAGITAELSRLGAVVVMTETGVTAAGARVTSGWEYRSSGLRGRISIQVLPAPGGHYWVIGRIFEPS
jgi:hypothetical protein